MRYKGLILTCFLCAGVLAANATPRHDSVIVINAGVDGNSTVNLLSRVNRDVLQKHPDVVVMMVGTNDMFFWGKNISIKQYKLNYQRLITRIKKHAYLILMTIPPVYGPYIISRKPMFHFKFGDPESKVDSANIIIRHLAANYKCPLIDLHRILIACGGASANKSSLFQNKTNFGLNDGVHPTYNGTRVIAAAVYQTINILKPDVKKIICFGDSITNGYRLKGAGTTNGQTYPAVLLKIFDL